MYTPLAARLAHLFAPETAHSLAITALRQDFMPLPRTAEHAALATEAWGLRFANPIGLAAGFDKNAEVYGKMLQAGFGFVEVGTVTPRPQQGNDKPRMFRLPASQAVINRLGFNNQGADAMEPRLPLRAGLPGIVGVNIGKNKDTEQALDDYLPLLRRFYNRASYITANISSPNTAGLRDLQRREQFEGFVRALRSERDSLAALHGFRVPLLVKIAPDVSDAELDDLVGTAMDERIDGLIIGNTTLSRPESVNDPHRAEQGGLSGKPLMPLSTDVLRKAYRLSRGELTLVGVGGIASAEDVLAKVRAGATLVQLYTAMAYQGLGLAQRIKNDLARQLARDGIDRLESLRGADIA